MLSSDPKNCSAISKKPEDVGTVVGNVVEVGATNSTPNISSNTSSNQPGSDGVVVGDSSKKLAVLAGGDDTPNASSNQSGLDDDSVDDSSKKLAALADDDDESFEWIPPSDDGPWYEEKDPAPSQEKIESRVESVLMSWDEESWISSSSSHDDDSDEHDDDSHEDGEAGCDDMEDNSSQGMDLMTSIEQLEDLALMVLDSEVEKEMDASSGSHDESSWSHVEEPEEKEEVLELDRAIAEIELLDDEVIAEIIQQDEYMKMEIDLALQGLEETLDTESIQMYWNGGDSGAPLWEHDLSATGTPKHNEGRFRYLQEVANPVDQLPVNGVDGITLRQKHLDGAFIATSSNAIDDDQGSLQATEQNSCEQTTQIPLRPTGYRARTTTARELRYSSRNEHARLNQDMSNEADPGTNDTEKIRWNELDSATQAALIETVLYSGSVDILEGEVWEDVRQKLLTITDAIEFQRSRLSKSAPSSTVPKEECREECTERSQNPNGSSERSEWDSDFKVNAKRNSKKWKKAIKRERVRLQAEADRLLKRLQGNSHGTVDSQATQPYRVHKSGTQASRHQGGQNAKERGGSSVKTKHDDHIAGAAPPLNQTKRKSKMGINKAPQGNR
jgi:hypothetical protein